jgi:hypothetical protein
MDAKTKAEYPEFGCSLGSAFELKKAVVLDKTSSFAQVF